jgi:hypothetical protein
VWDCSRICLLVLVVLGASMGRIAPAPFFAHLKGLPETGSAREAS